MVKKIKKMEYEHHPTNLLSKYVGEIDTCIFHESDINYKERKVLVVQAEAQSLNKAGPYLIVPGYIQSQKTKKNGKTVSVIELIINEIERMEIIEKIEKDGRFKGHINFWQI